VLQANKTSISKHRKFECTSNDNVRKRVEAVMPEMLNHKSPFATRLEVQKKMNIPEFPATAIGFLSVHQCRRKTTHAWRFHRKRQRGLPEPCLATGPSCCTSSQAALRLHWILQTASG
jgi:hypothetical protein